MAEDGAPIILVGIDGSDTSLRAGAYAAGQGRRLGAKVVALYVHSLGGLAAAAPGAVAAITETSAAVADELRQTIERYAPERGIDVDFVERAGNPYTELMRLAEQLPADAVIVGASMQAGHRLVGSLAVHLVRAAKWPVTVVP